MFVVYEVGINPGEVKFRKERMSSIPVYRDCVPMLITSVHYCYSDSRMQALVNLFFGIADKNLRIRFRGHCGKF